MKRNRTTNVSALAAAAALAAALPAGQALAESLAATLGKVEYNYNCASCHGESGAGDGPMAAELTTPPSDLQQISKNNGGVFPFDRVYQLIDGRETLRAHGTSDMPIWGRDYAADAMAMSGQRERGQGSIEAAIAGRVLSLVYYVQSIQKP